MKQCRSVVISIHDVAPSTAAEVRWLLATLDEMGARPRVLKVIPNENGHADLSRDMPLVELLREQRAAGSEVVLHGFTHHAEGSPRGPLPGRVRARIFAGSAAEFLSLDREQIAQRLAAGRDLLTSLGLEPRGFCAPAWLAPPELPALAREAGLRYLAGMATLDDLVMRRRLWLPWLGYMGASESQERLIGFAGRALSLAALASPVIKVFLHPQHARGSRSCRQVLHALARILGDRRPVTYAELLSA